MPSTTGIAILGAGILVSGAFAQNVPAAAQIIDQKTFNVLDFVPPPAEANDSTVRTHSLPGYCAILMEIGISLAWSHSGVSDREAVSYLR